MRTILACGDIGGLRSDCRSLFEGCASALLSADLVIGQLEAPISDRGERAPNARLAMRCPPGMAMALRSAGFKAMSFAGNHCMDFGAQAFYDTLAHADAASLVLAGCGPDVDSACAPQWLDAGGLRVALVAACSILPDGYEAQSDSPGCAPLRAFTHYEPVEHDQPGLPPRIHTFCLAADLDRLRDSVSAARERADLVLVSMHWGIHMVPHVLADYQIEAAHALVDAGADAVFGHHSHLLKGIELYRGKPIFYSLGNFAIEQPHVWDPEISRSASFRHLVSLNPSWSTGSAYMLPEITRATGLAKLVILADGTIEARFVPAWIGNDCVPQIAIPGSDGFRRVVEVLNEATVRAGFSTSFEVNGQELVLLARGMTPPPLALG